MPSLVLLAAAALAASDPAPSAVAGPPASAPAAVPTSASRPAAAPISDARARYDAAREILLRGDFEGAARALDAVAADPGAGPLGSAARALSDAARELARRGRFVLTVPGVPAPPGALDRSGRGELAWFSTLLGIWAADGLAYVAGMDDGKSYLALTIAGGSLGLAASLAATRRSSFSDGRASTVSSAWAWSSVNAAVVAAIAEADARDAVGATLGAGLAAVVVAAAATRDGAPTVGDVALVNSGGWWGLTAGALALTFLHEPDGSTVGWVLLGGTDAGLLAGASLARALDVSRGRTLVVDAAGILGGLVGVAIPVFADARDSATYGLSTLGGIAAGLTVGAVLTRDWDEPVPASASTRRAMPVATRLADGTLVAGIAGAF